MSPAAITALSTPLCSYMYQVLASREYVMSAPHAPEHADHEVMVTSSSPLPAPLPSERAEIYQDIYSYILYTQHGRLIAVIASNKFVHMFATRSLSAFRQWMPTMPMTLVSAKNATATSNATATFRVLPRMTKHEIKEHLEKIYNLPVLKVNTMNYMGKRKRVLGMRKIAYYKYRDYKKAIVTFDESLADVGLGTRIPDKEEQETLQQEQDDV